MNKKIYNLTTHMGEDWALIETTASKESIQRIWTQVIREDAQEDTEELYRDSDPLDRFMDQLQDIDAAARRIFIEDYIAP